MKTPLLYGALMAIIGALITFGLFFAGFHDTASKFQVGQWIGSGFGLLTGIVCLALAMRERRAEYPVNRTWGYGPAVGTGVMTGLWAVLFGAVLAYVYFAIVNPNFGEFTYQMQVAKLQAKGMTPSQIEAASGVMRKFLSPVVMTIFQAIGGFVWSVILALIVAIFFRKPVAVAEPSELETPPPVA